MHISASGTKEFWLKTQNEKLQHAMLNQLNQCVQYFVQLIHTNVDFNEAQEEDIMSHTLAQSIMVSIYSLVIFKGMEISLW